MTILIRWHQSAKETACEGTRLSGIVVFNNTLQGYARKRTLKPGGYSFCAKGVR